MQQKKMMASSVSDPSQNNLNRFAGASDKGLQITPEQTLKLSAVFIAAVFVLHVLGKIVGFGAAQFSPSVPEEAPEQNVD